MQVLQPEPKSCKTIPSTCSHSASCGDFTTVTDLFCFLGHLRNIFYFTFYGHLPFLVTKFNSAHERHQTHTVNMHSVSKYSTHVPSQSHIPIQLCSELLHASCLGVYFLIHSPIASVLILQFHTTFIIKQTNARYG